MRNKRLIRIELLSDMCVSDGSAYNSLIDTDICHDSYGFPFIPAKRLRGCLRECALELDDWGDSIHTASLFGDKGASSNGAKLRISNAYLKDYKELRDYVINNQGNVITHPQNIMGAFSYIRTQTRIDYETGVAENNSLRATRVADKGLVFIAEAEVEQEYEDELRRCCSVLRHMGISRTRGLGEVKVSLIENSSELKTQHAPLEDGAEELTYEIELKEPVICKSVNGGESNTLDYIEGAKILGLIAGNLNGNYLDFMKKGTLRSYNAYIAKNGVRYTEVPGYIYSIKNNKNEFINKLAETQIDKESVKDLQLNQTKHCYVHLEGDRLSIADVMTEERYHHRRPDDKSIGRAAANEDGDADFYQMDSISEGQKFIGKITGSPEQIKEVYGILSADRDFYIGYSKSSEYGKVGIRVTGTGKPEDPEETEAGGIVVTLDSPAVIYDDKAMAVSDPEILIDEVLSALGLTRKDEESGRQKVDIKHEEKYIRNTTLGGYNVTWNMRKPTLQAFDKGTSLKIEFAGSVRVPEKATIMIGERTSEGYGETEVMPFDIDSPYRGKIEAGGSGSEKSSVKADNAFARKLAEPLLDAYICKAAVDAAEKNKGTLRSDSEVYKPTVSNMILMLKNADNIEDVEAAVDDRYLKNSLLKEGKKGAAEAIFNEIKKAPVVLDAFRDKYDIEGLDVCEDEIKMKYLKEYLKQIKYILKGDDKDEQ